MVGITQYKRISNITTTDFTSTISQELPLDILGGIYCTCRVIVITSSNWPLTTNNMMGVISDLSILVNGSSRRVSLAGYILPQLSYIASRSSS